MSQLEPEQQQLLDTIRRQARQLATSVTAADSAGIPPAILLPELITILREAGFQIPAWVGRFGGLG